MRREFVFFLFPICRAKAAEKIIREKQAYLERFNLDGKCLIQEVEKLIGTLPEDLEKLKALLEKEIDRKRIVESKASNLFVIVSLLSVVFVLFCKLIDVMAHRYFLCFIGVFFFWKLLYLVLSISSLLYVLVELNIVYEPSKFSSDELKRSILLNRYQNLMRANYLSAVYSNIKLFFWLLFIVFTIFMGFLIWFQ